MALDVLLEEMRRVASALGEYCRRRAGWETLNNLTGESIGPDHSIAALMQARSMLFCAANSICLASRVDQYALERALEEGGLTWGKH